MFLHEIGPPAAWSRPPRARDLAGELFEGLHGDPLDIGLTRRCNGLPLRVNDNARIWMPTP